MPNYSREHQGLYLCEFHGFVGRGATPADALDSCMLALLRQAQSASAPTGLTEREKSLIDALEWCANVTHENYHRSEQDAGNRLACQQRACTYVNGLLERARAVG